MDVLDYCRLEVNQEWWVRILLRLPLTKRNKWGEIHLRLVSCAGDTYNDAGSEQRTGN